MYLSYYAEGAVIICILKLAKFHQSLLLVQMHQLNIYLVQSAHSNSCISSLATFRIDFKLLVHYRLHIASTPLEEVL